MTTLTRWDPFREMTTMRNMMDRFFDEEMMPSRLWGEQGQSMALPLDVSENQDNYMVKASIPGVDPDDVEITLHDNLLTIRGEMQQENAQENGQYHLRERRCGSFMRSITLPAAVDAEHVEANCDNGVLTLTIPKSPEAKPRRINIGSGSRTIEGQTTNGQSQQGQGSSNQRNNNQQKTPGNNGKSTEGSATAQSASGQGSTSQPTGTMEGRERSK